MKTAKEMITELIYFKECTQKQLAKELNVTESRITEWLKDTQPHFSQLCKIRKAYAKMKETQHENT